MDEIFGLSGAGGAALAAPSASNRASVSREEFLEILVAELTSQNPLDPLDNGEFIQQLVGLQQLEQTAALTDGLRSFQGFMELSSASALIGRAVSGVDAGGFPVEGVVERVTLQDGRVWLQVGTQALPLGAVREVRVAEAGTEG